MLKISFGEHEYDLVENRANLIDDVFSATIVKGDKTIEQIMEEAPCEVIKIKDEYGTVVSTFVGCDTLISIQLIKNYIVAVDPNTGAEEITDVISVRLQKRDEIQNRISDLENTIDILVGTLLE